jgi:hypothetical protein
MRKALVMDNHIKLNEQYDSLVKAFEDPYPSRIYHYTTGEGLRGIIQNSEIWLTNTAFVNDISEGRALQDANIQFSHGDFTNRYVEHWWDYFKKIKNIGEVEKDTYIASFSRSKNSIDQYRAYGNYCIGFDAKQLITRPGFYFYECVYDSDKIRKWILEKEKVKKWNGEILNKNEQWKSGAAHRLVYDSYKKFKHPAYKQEREVRIMAVSHHTWDFTNSPSMYAKDPPIHYRDHPKLGHPIPYVKLFITGSMRHKYTPRNTSKETSRQMKQGKREEETSTTRNLLPIREIWIGPMVHQDSAEIACKILLKDTGYDNVAINASAIPYRGF